MSAILILKAAPVESINRELNNTEKEHCKKVTMKILIGVIAFAICCTVGLIQDMLSLIALTTFIILISQSCCLVANACLNGSRFRAGGT